MKRQGVTLVEAVMGVLIGAIVILSLSRLFVSGLHTFRKGSSHLTNVQAAAILMNQIELDLAQAVEIPATTGPIDRLQVKILALDEATRNVSTADVTYQPAADNLGYRRVHASAGGIPTEHVFCRGLLVNTSFEPVTIPDPPSKQGFKVRITVETTLETEKNTLQRFVFLLNLPDNRRHQNGDWKW